MLNLRNLSVLNYVNGFTFWHYRTGDTLAKVTDPHYFSDASMLKVGDMVAINAGDGSGIRVVLAITTELKVTLGELG